MDPHGAFVAARPGLRPNTPEVSSLKSRACFFERNSIPQNAALASPIGPQAKAAESSFKEKLGDHGIIAGPTVPHADVLREIPSPAS